MKAHVSKRNEIAFLDVSNGEGRGEEKRKKEVKEYVAATKAVGAVLCPFMKKNGTEHALYARRVCVCCRQG